MKLCTSLCAVLLIVASGISTAHGTAFVNDNFDTYVDGGGAVDQAAFEAVWAPIGTVAPISATVTQAQSVSAANSIQVDSSNTNGQQQNRGSFTETGTLGIGDLMFWEIDFRENATFFGNPGRKYAILNDGIGSVGTNQIISIGTNNTQLAAQSGGNYYMARILGYVVPTGVGSDPDGGPDESLGGSGAWFKLNDFGVGLRTNNTWNNLKVVVTKDTAVGLDYYYYVNNQLAEKVSNIGTSAAATDRSWDKVVLGSGLHDSLNGDYFFDNAKVSTVLVGGADFNGDASVDAADYVIWRKNNGLTSGALYTDGDADGDGKVDFDDYIAWRFNFNPVLPPAEGLGGGGTVPEPATALLLMVGAAALLVGRWRPR